MLSMLQCRTSTILWIYSSLSLAQLTTDARAWSTTAVASRGFQSPLRTQHTTVCQAVEEWSDFDGYGEDGTDDSSSFDFEKALQERTASNIDYSAIQTRQFSLGSDLLVSDYLGNMGFDEVTDWEYYYPSDNERSDDRQVVQPNPFDASQTRTSSGSVVRIFRGELVGLTGATLSARGLDRRVLIKEYTGNLALSLAKAELESIGRMQSFLVESDESAKLGEWIQAASIRSVQPRSDCDHVLKLQKELTDAPFLGIFGEVNLAELDLAQNDFYRALGVKPPEADAVWVVYEYAGLATIQSYCVPAQIRRAKLPPKRGIFGNPINPPALPQWNERAKFVVQGIMKKSILAVASLHESGMVHRSIGQSSIVLTTKEMDKRVVTSPFNTRVGGLDIKLADFGFSGLYELSADDEEFCTRARAFGLSFRKGENNLQTANFAIAEDLHALGFVFLSLLLTSLAELKTPNTPMPAADEDTLQRVSSCYWLMKRFASNLCQLLGEIFEKDFLEFREYVDAEDSWSPLVALLDKNDLAGWKMLETLLTAREKVAKMEGDSSLILSVRGLLSNKIFDS